MERLRVVPALRQRLGDEGTEALTEMMFTAAQDSREEIWEALQARFENRLTIEISALRVDVTKELAGDAPRKRKRAGSALPALRVSTSRRLS